MSTFNAWFTSYPKSAVLILHLHLACILLLVYNLQPLFAWIYPWSTVLTLQCAGNIIYWPLLWNTCNCTQCIQYQAHVQCNVITYDLYIINIVCFILIRISTLVKLFYCYKIIFLSPHSPRLCIVSLFSWSIKPTCTPLTKPEEKVRLLAVYPTLPPSSHALPYSKTKNNCNIFVCKHILIMT